MNKKLLSIVIAAAVLAVGAKALPTLAQTDTSVEALQKQIQLLLSQMQALQQQVTTLRSTPATTPTTTTAPTTVPTPVISPVTGPGADDELTAERGTIPPPNIFRTLRRGSRGNDVRALQEYLAEDPTIYPQGFTTGFYGPSTETAVKRWQTKYGVEVIGIVGPKTIAKFRELRAALLSDEIPFEDDGSVYPRPEPQYCPVYAYMPVCKEGQSTKDSRGCTVCQAKPKLITDPPICPALATVDSCPAGEERIITYKSEQCGIYYACKPRIGAPNTVAVLKKASSIQTDNRYTLNLYDSEGVQKYAVYTAKDRQIYLGYPSCRNSESTPVISAESSDFPLKLYLSDCANGQYNTSMDTPVIVRQIQEGLTFPYKFSNGKVVSSSEEARSYCYVNGPGTGQGVAAECETKFGVIYTTITRPDRAIYSSDAFAACMARYGFSAEAKQIKAWAQLSEPIPWSALSGAAQAGVQTCEREYYGQQTVETGSVLCTDGKDNDGDGFIDSADPSCSSSVPVTPQAGQKEQTWNSLGLKSWIRTDADSARIEQLKSTCAAVPSGSNIWMPNAGVSTSADFGMPDTAKCQRASSCTAGQYFDGSACVANTTTTTGTAQCSDGRDNDNDGFIDYPRDTGCYSAADNDETPGTGTTTTDCSRYGTGWHVMGDNNCYNSGMTEYRTANGTLYSCTATPATGCAASGTTACSDGRDNDGDGLIDYPSDTGCYGPADSDEAYGGTTTTTGSCDSTLTALLGTGCHYMYNDSAGNQIYCDGNMTKSAKRGDTATTSGCSSSSTTAWPTDQASCTSKGYKWCTSSSSTGWCQSNACPTGDSSYYAGDANSCPSFAYSRWDQQNRRYCQLNNETRCDYNYPSYLTNGANYTAANCPTYASGTALGVCSSLGSDWTVYGNYCLNNSRTQYAPTGSSLSSVQACTGADSPVTGCTPPGGSTTTTTTTDSCSKYGSGWHVMGDGNCYNSPMTEYYTAGGTLYFCSSTPSSGCSSSTTTTTSSSCTTPSNCYDSAKCSSSGWYWYNSGCWSSPQTTTTTTTTTSCPSGQYWNGTACVSSTTTTTTTTTSSCPSGYHSMGNYCMSDSNSTQCQPTGGGATYTCSSTPTAAVYDVTAHLLSQAKSLLRSLSDSLRGIRR
ncbi:MAG: peptidoglycan-binding domain-containing protein [Patescibacteria group bacterium]